MIAAWVIKKPKKLHKCQDCGKLMSGPHLRLFGGEDCYDKPWVGRWCFDCVKYSQEPKVRKALKKYISGKMEADPNWPSSAVLVELLHDWKALIPRVLHHRSHTSTH